MKKLIFPLVFILFAFYVSSTSYCFPEYNGAEIIEQCNDWSIDTMWQPLCNDINIYQPSGMNLLCTNGFKIGDFYYCNIPEDVVVCAEGCMNGKCIGDMEACNVGEQWCGTHPWTKSGFNQPNSDGKYEIHECVKDGNDYYYEVVEYCDSGCENVFNIGTRYQCTRQMYYCNLYGSYCFQSSNNGEKCFETLEECENSGVVYCLDSTGKTCTKRFGKCLSNEREFSGTDELSVYKSCMNARSCSEWNPCPQGFECIGGTCDAILDPDVPVCGQGDYICLFLAWLGETGENINKIMFWVFWIGVIVILARLLLPAIGYIFRISLGVTEKTAITSTAIVARWRWIAIILGLIALYMFLRPYI
jgi:hypothetical protein